MHQQLPTAANGILAAQVSSAQPTSVVSAIASAQALALQQMQQYGLSGLPNTSLHNQLALAAQQHQGISEFSLLNSAYSVYPNVFVYYKRKLRYLSGHCPACQL